MQIFLWQCQFRTSINYDFYTSRSVERFYGAWLYITVWVFSIITVIMIVIKVTFWTDFIVDSLVTYAILSDPMYFYLPCTLETTLSSGNGSFGKVQSSATMETGWELYSLPRLNLNKFVCVSVPVLHVRRVYRRRALYPSNCSDTVSTTTTFYPALDNYINLTIGKERYHMSSADSSTRSYFILMDFLSLSST